MKSLSACGERFRVRLIFHACLLSLLTACNFAAPPSPTPTPTTTLTPSPTVPTLTPTLARTATLAPTPTLTLSPTLTMLPSATPTITPTEPPTLTPWATTGFVGDHFKRVDIPKPVSDAVGKTWLSFVNISDAKPLGTPGTPVAASDLETVYLVSPDGATRLKVIDLPATTERRIFWSPNGAYMAYFLAEGDAPGLYLLDIEGKTTTRLFDMSDLNPRGFQTEPIWAPDSSQITVALTTPYDIDLFGVAPDSSSFNNLSKSGAFDLWPVWSPDGAYLAFVSDRVQCPSWTPGEPNTCYTPEGKAPEGGNLFILDAASKTIRQLGDQVVTGAPHWITPARIAFTTGGNTASDLWWVDLRGGPPRQVTTTDPNNPKLSLRDAWSPDGHLVLYQEVESTTRLILRDENGAQIAKLDQLNFPRYSFAAAWSPDGQKVVIGGHNGQCPFGIIIADPTLKLLLNAPSSPSVCDPAWSPDGRYIAFTGITKSTSGSDGRYDLYIAEASGYGSRNLTGRLGGQIRVLGWIKGTK